MSFGSSLGAFAEGFAASRQSKKDREERQQQLSMQDRYLTILEKNPELLSRTSGSLGAVPPQDAAGGGAVAAASAPTGDIADKVRSGLVNRGMAPHIAEGWALNFQDESGFKTGAVGDSGNAFGLAQWNGPRKQALMKYAASRGADPSDIDAQLDYLMTELNGSEKGAWAKIQATNTPGEAAAAIVNSFERPAEVHRARREKAYLAYRPKAELGATPPAY